MLIKQIKHTSHWYGWHNYLNEENAYRSVGEFVLLNL